jgi:hypothetical protein
MVLKIIKNKYIACLGPGYKLILYIQILRIYWPPAYELKV